MLCYWLTSTTLPHHFKHESHNHKNSGSKITLHKTRVVVQKIHPAQHSCLCDLSDTGWASSDMHHHGKGMIPLQSNWCEESLREKTYIRVYCWNLATSTVHVRAIYYQKFWSDDKFFLAETRFHHEDLPCQDLYMHLNVGMWIMIRKQGVHFHVNVRSYLA